MEEKQQLHQLVDRLADSEVGAATRYLEFLLAHEPAVDDEMLARIDEARENPSPGIPHEEVLREFGL